MLCKQQVWAEAAAQTKEMSCDATENGWTGRLRSSQVGGVKGGRDADKGGHHIVAPGWER